MPDEPLTGITVVELTTMIAGPYAGQMLGDLGADVVKIERPDTGELARQIDPKIVKSDKNSEGESFYFLTANRNKQSLALDITKPEGKEVFIELIKNADIIIENFPPTFTEKFEIAYEHIKEHNEDIIYCSISAFGETGPYRTFPGIDTTVQAMSGAMSMTRDESSAPMRSGVPMTDVFAALYAVQGILAALLNRFLTGEGEYLDISLLDSGLAGLTTRATYSFATENPYPAFGSHHNYLAPEGVYEAADGHIQISVVTNNQWRSFCDALSMEHLAEDERFESIDLRVQNHGILEESIEDELSNWQVEDALSELRSVGVPVAPIENTLSAFENPQVQSRDMRKSVIHPQIGEFDTLGFPIKYENIQPSIRQHPPVLGEHTEAILNNIGINSAKIEKLRENGIISTPN